MSKKITISALANALNIVVGMIPAFFVIPYIAKNFGNNGVAHWNLFLAYISIYLLIADYGYNEDASKRVQTDSRNILKIVKAKIYTTLVASVFILIFFMLDLLSNVSPFCIVFTVASYAFNPIYYYQAKNKSEIPLLLNSLTVIVYILAIFTFENLTLEQVMYIFASRVATMNLILWRILVKDVNLNLNLNEYVDIIRNSVGDEFKGGFARFFHSIGSSFLNSGYIILASTQLDKNLFAQYTMIHKLVFIALMFVISYCQTAMLAIEKTKLVILSIIMVGLLYFGFSESILKYFGIDAQDVEPLFMNLSGSLFFILMGVSTLFYFKIIHSGHLKTRAINIFNMLAMGLIIFTFAFNKVPDYLVLWIPVLYSLLYLIIVLKVYKSSK